MHVYVNTLRYRLDKIKEIIDKSFFITKDKHEMIVTMLIGQIEDFGLYEINEAFAAQSVACMKELKINPKLLNVNGGAVALGHPLGCSGSRIVTTLLYEMKRRNIRWGLASICVAGGLGMAMAIENLNYK